LSYEQVARRLRLPLGFILAALYLAFGPRPSPLTLGVGVALALGGLTIRAWAAGHIVKNDRLATTGPYAHTRNPLYFGSFLIAAGFAIAVRGTTRCRPIQRSVTLPRLCGVGCQRMARSRRMACSVPLRSAGWAVMRLTSVWTTLAGAGS